jgi:hypothetical protein
MAERPSEDFSEQPMPPPPGAEPERDPDEKDGAARHASVARIMELQERGHKGANWFFWVAGLSLVNSVIMHGGGATYFVVGLGVTLLVDAVCKDVGEQNPDIHTLLRVFAIGFALAVAVMVTGFGWLARKGILIVYAIGMALYLLDGLLFLVLQDLMSVAFHGFALFWMWSGFSAFREINKITAEMSEPPD